MIFPFFRRRVMAKHQIRRRRRRLGVTETEAETQRALCRCCVSTDIRDPRDASQSPRRISHSPPPPRQATRKSPRASVNRRAADVTREKSQSKKSPNSRPFPEFGLPKKKSKRKESGRGGGEGGEGRDRRDNEKIPHFTPAPLLSRGRSREKGGVQEEGESVSFAMVLLEERGRGWPKPQILFCCSSSLRWAAAAALPCLSVKSRDSGNRSLRNEISRKKDATLQVTFFLSFPIKK